MRVYIILLLLIPQLQGKDKCTMAVDAVDDFTKERKQVVNGKNLGGNIYTGTLRLAPAKYGERELLHYYVSYESYFEMQSILLLSESGAVVTMRSDVLAAATYKPKIDRFAIEGFIDADHDQLADIFVKARINESVEFTIDKKRQSWIKDNLGCID